MGNRHIGIGEEVTWNTPVAAEIFLEALSEGVQLEPGYQEIKTIRSDYTRIMALLRDVVRGPIAFQANYQELAHLFYYFFGDVDTTGAGPYVHTIPGSTGVGVRPPLSIEIQRDEGGDGDTWKYAGNVITALSLSVAVEQAMQGELAVVGASSDETASPTGSPTYLDFDIVIPSHVTCTIDAAELDAESFSLNVAWPVEELGKLGSTVLSKKPASSDVIAVSGDVLVQFADLTEYTLFKNHSDVDVQLSCDSGGDEQLVINLDKAKILLGTPHIDGRGTLKATMSFQSYFNTTATGALQVVVTNDEAVVP